MTKKNIVRIIMLVLLAAGILTLPIMTCIIITLAVELLG